jgi:NADPH:quinone reductase-like Zn-dependent oxidoreductase
MGSSAMPWSYLLESPPNGGALEPRRADRPTVDPGAGEIRVRVTARSLNYRDLLMRRGQSASGAGGGVVPLSDGAGIVEAVGGGVTEFAPGDRVTGCFFRDWIDGPFDLGYHKAARGGSCDGMLAERVTASAHSFVPTPPHLSDAEAACLPCAALTAWHALFERGGLREGQTVLALGTGGVSILALQLAAAAGARVIVTSSSDEKRARARELGAWETINYRDTPEWSAKVWEITDQRGADYVVEVGGPGTIGQSLNAVAAGGHIALIGVLTGFAAPDASLFPLLTRNADLHGIYVGSRAMFLRMNSFISSHGIRPVIDREFAVDDVAAAYAHLAGGSHLGKVVVVG